ncbi:hypothetical protein HRI_001622700 [Hibiscus trionum]|uniref:Dormancy-associated protein homolog 3 n=1 Tax=Hibiscus trionum TaxID=183268 RepID=A0A9W7LWB9_HIBTR|nr:hypothetical protein HRI_001622700 [Hibiscus trionum]
MGLLDQLWDETVAGPPPENGLGKLRKRTFRLPYSAKESDCGSVRSYGDETPSEEEMRVTHSIMIAKPQGYEIGSPPVSPDGTSPPVSPFSGSPFGFGEDRHRMPLKGPTRFDQGALILLTTCEM